MLRTFSVVACSLLLLGAGLLPVRGEALPDAKSRLLEDVKYLSSDDLEGRGIGTNGLKTAAEFIRNEFADKPTCPCYVQRG